MSAHAVAASLFKTEIHTSNQHKWSKSDLVAAHASAHAKVLRAPLSFSPNRIPEYEFRSWMRFFLSLPPLTRLGNAQLDPDLGYEVEHCLTHPHRALDAHGNHANSGCPTAAAGLSARHTALKYSIYYAAQEAGCYAAMEPKQRTCC